MTGKRTLITLTIFENKLCIHYLISEKFAVSVQLFATQLQLRWLFKVAVHDDIIVSDKIK